VVLQEVDQSIALTLAMLVAGFLRGEPQWVKPLSLISMLSTLDDEPCPLVEFIECDDFPCLRLRSSALFPLSQLMRRVS
jgi:hypothetical protein